ncbi:MAG: Dihydroneopterin aldolase / Amino acid kinase-like protein, possibly delta 1-pyrroline-5-carboxylate synthetase [uncultured Rubellimicrobium sp.]|uniref:dihydroneopterin aldolase n=1 Tax=uncultured Rubellimicrobium sp. TaxID=543078 RepID=A0A6J4NCS0_9RHOB|nr:MAG: Dihydroneopterin aldolase / Amino acid kinase-like protein, possibly delta 1-pyrroline-5-carboxylate synthetase [uncultured Rubellimicrobium sp.]
MTDDLSTAFDLHARAEAMGGPLDRISLRDHVVAAEIGAFEVERGVTQRLRFDIVVEVLPLGDAGDDVDRILSYDRLADAVAAELAAERLALLETLASRIASRILREPQAARVFLRVQKLDRGPGDLGVEIVRSREETGAEPSGSDNLPLRVVLLGEREAESASLSAMIDQLTNKAGALLLVAPACPSPRARTPDAQNRLDLLAADQGAWLLAERDDRLEVAATRTELDWHLRRGRPVVWAPAKLSIDGGWSGADPLFRTVMFAEAMGALEVLLIGPSPGGLMEAPLRVRRATLDAPLEERHDWTAPE